MTAVATETQTENYPLVDADWGPDPLADIPAELIQRYGSMDHDTAGGCG